MTDADKHPSGLHLLWNKFFRIASNQFSEHFTPEEKVAPNLHLSLLILHDAVRAALEVLIASRDLTQEQQDELHLWLSKYIDLL